MSDSLSQLGVVIRRNAGGLIFYRSELEVWLIAIEPLLQPPAIPLQENLLSHSLTILEKCVVVQWNNLLRDLRGDEETISLASHLSTLLRGVWGEIFRLGITNTENEVYQGIESACKEKLLEWDKLDPEDVDLHFLMLQTILGMVQHQVEHCYTSAAHRRYELHHPMLYEYLSCFVRERHQDLRHYRQTHERDLTRECIIFMVRDAEGNLREWHKPADQLEHVDEAFARLGVQLSPEFISLFEQFHNQDTNPPAGISFSHARNLLQFMFFGQFIFPGGSRRMVVEWLANGSLKINITFDMYTVIDCNHDNELIFSVNNRPLLTFEVSTDISLRNGGVAIVPTHYFQDNTDDQLFQCVIDRYCQDVAMQRRYRELLVALETAEDQGILIQRFADSISQDTVAKNALSAMAIHAALVDDQRFMGCYLLLGLPLYPTGFHYPDVFDEMDQRYSRGLSILHYAALNGRDELLRHIMAAATVVDLSIRDTWGNTPCHYAAQCGHLQFIQYVCETWKYRELNQINNDGDTPLHRAAANGYTAIVSYLLAHPELGFDINQQNNLGQTPAHLADQYGHRAVFDMLLDVADDSFMLRLPGVESPHPRVDIKYPFLSTSIDGFEAITLGAALSSPRADISNEQRIQFLMRDGVYSLVFLCNVFGALVYEQTEGIRRVALPWRMSVMLAKLIEDQLTPRLPQRAVILNWLTSEAFYTGDSFVASPWTVYDAEEWALSENSLKLQHAGWQMDPVHICHEGQMVNVTYRLQVTGIKPSNYFKGLMPNIWYQAQRERASLCEIRLIYKLTHIAAAEDVMPSCRVELNIECFDYTAGQYFVQSRRYQQAQDQYPQVAQSEEGFVRVYGNLQSFSVTEEMLPVVSATRESLLARIVALDEINMMNIIRVHGGIVLNVLRYEDLPVIEQAITASLADCRRDEHAHNLFTWLKKAVTAFLAGKAEFSEILTTIEGAQSSRQSILDRLYHFIENHSGFFKYYNPEYFRAGPNSFVNLVYFVLSSHAGIALFWQLINSKPGIALAHPREAMRQEEKAYFRKFFDHMRKHGVDTRGQYELMVRAVLVKSEEPWSQWYALRMLVKLHDRFITIPILQYAVGLEHQTLIGFVCQYYPALINVQDNQGNAALHVAVLRRNRQAVQALTAAGANVLLINNEGKIALDLAEELSLQGVEMARICRCLKLAIDEMLRINQSILEDTLHTAAQKGYCAIIARLIPLVELDRRRHPYKNKYFNLNVQHERWQATALHFAVYHRQDAVVRLLLAHGVNTEVVDVSGNTSFLMAAFCHNIDALTQLYRAGAVITAQCVGRDHYGKNAIAFARLNRNKPRTVESDREVAELVSILKRMGVREEAGVVANARGFFPVSSSGQVQSTVHAGRVVRAQFKVTF